MSNFVAAGSEQRPAQAGSGRPPGLPAVRFVVVAATAVEGELVVVEGKVAVAVVVPTPNPVARGM